MRLSGRPLCRQSLEEDICRRALEIGLTLAHRFGLYRDAAEDCALGFVTHILLAARRGGIPPFLMDRADVHGDRVNELGNPKALDRWLTRCAANWTRNVCRSYRRRQRWERCFTEIISEPNNLTGAEPVSVRLVGALSTDEFSPEASLFRSELREQIGKAMRLARLTPRQIRLWNSYYLWGADIADLALETARSPNAVRQELWALRRRLRIALAKIGWDSAVIADYLLTFEHFRCGGSALPRVPAGTFETR